MAQEISDAKKIEEAQKMAKKESSKAEAMYQDILAKDPGSSDAGLRNYELALMGLGELYRDQRCAPLNLMRDVMCI